MGWFFSERKKKVAPVEARSCIVPSPTEIEKKWNTADGKKVLFSAGAGGLDYACSSALDFTKDPMMELNAQWKAAQPTLLKVKAHGNHAGHKMTEQLGKKMQTVLTLNKPPNSGPSNSENKDDEPIEIEQSVLDSPLQHAMALLHLLRRHLTAKGTSKKNELALVARVIELLSVPDLLATGTDVARQPVVAQDSVIQEWLGLLSVTETAERFKNLLNKSQTTPTGVVDKRQLSRSIVGTMRNVSIRPPAEEDLLILPALRKSLLSDAESEVLQMLEHGLDEWQFDSWHLQELTGGHALAAVGYAMSHRHGWHRDLLKVSADKMWSFFEAVEAKYRSVTYHNSVHATDVTQSLHFIVTQFKSLQGIVPSPAQQFATVLAAIVHDVDHDGFNKAFHIGSGSELALLYSDQAPLEMHHLATAFSILGEHNILSKMNSELRRTLRDRVIGMVLGTDFSDNMKIVNRFKLMLTNPERQQKGQAPAPRTLYEADKRGEPIFSSQELLMSANEQMLVSVMAIKLADLSYLSKGVDYSAQWAARCAQEFLEQGDEEKARGLKCHFDRASYHEAKGHIGFATFLCKPIYEALGKLIPLEPQLHAVEQFIEHWQSRIKEQECSRVPTPIESDPVLPLKSNSGAG